jgi:hypothetical protein
MMSKYIGRELPNAHSMTVMARKMINNENVIVNSFHHFMQDNEWKKRIRVQNHF